MFVKTYSSLTCCTAVLTLLAEAFPAKASNPAIACLPEYATHALLQTLEPYAWEINLTEYYFVFILRSIKEVLTQHRMQESKLVILPYNVAS